MQSASGGKCRARSQVARSFRSPWYVRCICMFCSMTRTRNLTATAPANRECMVKRYTNPLASHPNTRSHRPAGRHMAPLSVMTGLPVCRPAGLHTCLLLDGSHSLNPSADSHIDQAGEPLTLLTSSSTLCTSASGPTQLPASTTPYIHKRLGWLPANPWARTRTTIKTAIPLCLPPAGPSPYPLSRFIIHEHTSRQVMPPPASVESR